MNLLEFRNLYCLRTKSFERYINYLANETTYSSPATIEDCFSEVDAHLYHLNSHLKIINKMHQELLEAMTNDAGNIGNNNTKRNRSDSVEEIPAPTPSTPPPAPKKSRSKKQCLRMTVPLHRFADCPEYPDSETQILEEPDPVIKL